jgi:hypothetical protein
MTNNFVDVLGTDISNIKTGDDFLNQEELSYLLNIMKIGESRYKGTDLHFSPFHTLTDSDELNFEIFTKINNRIFDFVTKAYNRDFKNEG